MDPTSHPLIAVFSGPTATVANSAPLVTSQQARERHGLPSTHGGDEGHFDAVRPQRLAAPVEVYIEAFSAHPLEADAAELYASPDGFLGDDGAFRQQRRDDGDVPVYRAVLRPEDGLYLLPYMARQHDGGAWEHEGLTASGPVDTTRQTYYPDASRIFEEIDRFGVDARGRNNLLRSKADFDFVRAAPSGGYTKGISSGKRTDVGEGHLPPERWGTDFFPYRPYHLQGSPPSTSLAELTNVVQGTLAGGRYQGAIWLEGSPALEDTMYWLNLVIDAAVPIVGCASQRPHGSLSNDGDRNIVDAVDYIRSGIWADEQGGDVVGPVVIQDEVIFSVREVQKGDARPGGFTTTGGHGGIVGTMGNPGPPRLTFLPVRAHGRSSMVNLSRIPSRTTGTAFLDGRVSASEVAVKDGSGDLRPDAIPKVTTVKYGRFGMDGVDRDPTSEVEIRARIQTNLERFPLAGFILEGNTPFGRTDETQTAALRRAVAHGMPVVCTSRGNAEGVVPEARDGIFLSATNLTASKARFLLMACLLRFGSPPPANDPDNVTSDEWQAIRTRLDAFQEVFSTH